MSSMLLAELVATCNALGVYDEQNKKYFVDSYTLDTVKDLIRYLRRDGEDHEIRRHLGQTKVLQTDLVPMMISHSDKSELFEVTLRLIVNLTNPTLLLYHEEMPSERVSRNHYLQMVAHLQSYKEEAFTNVDIWEVFAKKLMNLLEKDWTERDDDSSMCIERILILIRNILHVPSDPDRERKPDNDASVHDKVLWALNQSSMMDIILYLSTENEKQYLMHILEILSLAMREQNPSSLADAALHRSVEEKLRDEQELLQIRMNESRHKNVKVKQIAANRHSRFGGTYVVKNMKSISDNDMICHKPLSTIMKLDFDSKKIKINKPKNRRPDEYDTVTERRSAFAIRLFLKEFCIKFLNMAYNPLMNYAMDVLVRSKAQQNDESYYLWAMKFFMEFNRAHEFQVKYVSETISVPTFYYVQQQMDKYVEMIKMDQKKYNLWIKRLHLALKAYRELLNTLMVMEKSTDLDIRNATKVIESNIFYMLEYRECLLTLMLNFDQNKMPRVYIRDLVETTHIFLKMLERFCKKNDLVVQKQVRGKASRKTKTSTKKKKPLEQNKDAEWDEIGPQLLAVFRSDAEISTNVIPFDAASDVPIDDQKEDCMKRIQKLMMDHKFEDSIGMLRAAREIWPDDGIFGTANMAIDEEYSMMETIYMADIGVVPSMLEEETHQPEGAESNDVEDDDDEEDEEEPSSRIAETEFDFPDFVNRFARPKVVMACNMILQDFEKIQDYTWHCALKMLHRIAWDCKQYAMVCQASLFRTFQKILDNDLPQFKELRKFAIFIIKKFTDIAQRNPHAFMDLLFWKSPKEAFEMDCGYNETYDKHGTGAAWSIEQEDELRHLFEENQANPSNEQDVIDWILDNLIDKTRSRRMVIKKLKDLGLIFKAPTRKSNKMATAREKVPVEFNENEDKMLHELWEQFGDTIDPMTFISSRMPLKRPKKRFVERLLELGIVQNKAQCRKKRSTKSGTNQDASSSESSESDSSDTGNANIRSKTKHKSSEVAKKQSGGKPSVPYKDIAKSLVAAVNEGHTEALRWIMESIEEVALDQEAEGYDPNMEGIPLVPISEFAALAMDNDVFQACLKAVGIESPCDEQEIYWRIPSSMHHSVLRSRNEIISKAIDGTLLISDEDVNERPELENAVGSNSERDNFRNRATADTSSDEDDDVFARVRGYGVDDDIIDGVVNLVSTSNLKLSEKSKVNDVDHRRPSEVECTTANSRKKNKKKQTLDSSSDEDEDVFTRVRNYGIDVDSIMNDEGDVSINASKDCEKNKVPESKRKRSSDSDNTVDRVETESKKKKTKIIRIESDSDDDGEMVNTQKTSQDEIKLDRSINQTEFNSGPVSDLSNNDQDTLVNENLNDSNIKKLNLKKKKRILCDSDDDSTSASENDGISKNPDELFNSLPNETVQESENINLGDSVSQRRRRVIFDDDSD